MFYEVQSLSVQVTIHLFCNRLKPLLFHPSSGVSKEQRMRYHYYQAPICAVCMLLLTAKFRGLRRRQLGQIHNISRGRARTN